MVAAILGLFFAAVACAAAAYSANVLGRVVAASRLAKVNADEITLLHARIDLLGTGIKRIEGRVVKAAQRSGANSDGPPDPKADPEGWKAWQNRAIAKGRQLQ
jgi:hypothetical protein